MTEREKATAVPTAQPIGGIFSGPRERWTEIIQRHKNLRRTLLDLLKALVLIYLFLVAIKMMGQGVKDTGKNPDYDSAREAVKALGDPAFGLAPEKAAAITPADLPPGERAELQGRELAASIGPVNLEGGLIAFKDHALKAVLVDGLLREKARAKNTSPVRVRAVTDEHVVIEPIQDHKDWLFTLFSYARNPFLALLVGVLITAIFQSSSFTTSFTVGLVAAVDFPLAYAIPIIMGANIGTSVTNILVALSYIRRKSEFERAFAGATVHDFFNVLTVAVLFTVEATTHVLSSAAGWLAGLVYRSGAAAGGKPTNVISLAVDPVVNLFNSLLKATFGSNEMLTGIIMAAVGVVLLFAALLLLVKVLRKIVLQRAESFFDRVLFRNAGVAFAVGLVLTAAVQSSSVTTSLVVPLIAAGVLTLNQVFPYMLGANIGTTVTALLAAFATQSDTTAQAKVGLTLACAHLLFNVIGAIIFYPLRWIPIGLARGLARKAAESKRYAVIFVLGVFFGLPLLGIGLHALWSRVFGG